MKLAKSTLLVWLAVLATAGFFFLPATGCKKAATPKPIQSTLSPEQAKEQRLTWNLKTLVEAYEKAGHTSPKWDEPAKRALTEFARTRSKSTESNEAWGLIISTNCIAAVDAGCDDPMIRYLHARFVTGEQRLSAKECADVICKAATALQQSSYPDIRKFYASLRAVQQLYSAFGTNADRQAIGSVGGGIKNYLEDAIKDKSMPLEDVCDACHEGIEIYRGTQNLYEEIEKPLFDRWPDRSEIWLLKGEAYIKKAWNARGGGYAYTVSDKGWEHFNERLATAEEALEHAWKLNPKDPEIARQMMTVMLGQGEGRDRMELWFDRAMVLDPNDYDACSRKLYYLEPKWYGSREAMLDFGRECVQNTNWAGRVPLVLVDAHWNFCRGYIDKSEQTNYWKQPDVWAEIKSAYDRFFQLNTNTVGYYEYYAWYAYQAGQWDVLNELIPKLGPETYYHFGGKDEFDKIVRLAKEHANKPN